MKRRRDPALGVRQTQGETVRSEPGSLDAALRGGPRENRVACLREERTTKQRVLWTEKAPVALRRLYFVQYTFTLCFKRSLSALRRGGIC